MTQYTIVTDEIQRVINEVTEELFAVRTDYKFVDEDIAELRRYVCGHTERTEQTASGQDLDTALSDFYTKTLDPFFEDLVGELGGLNLAMQDVLNFFVSGDAEQALTSRETGEFAFDLTTSGQGDPPPSFDTREWNEGKELYRDISDSPATAFTDSTWNHRL